MTSLRCTRCGNSRDLGDNFCRSCGHQLTVDLPAVRPVSLPARRGRAIPPSVVGSVAALAVGTGIEWLARRMAGSAARAAGRALTGQKVLPGRSVTKARESGPETVAVDEILYIRKVQLRR